MPPGKLDVPRGVTLFEDLRSELFDRSCPRHIRRGTHSFPFKGKVGTGWPGVALGHKAIGMGLVSKLR